MYATYAYGKIINIYNITNVKKHKTRRGDKLNDYSAKIYKNETKPKI